MLWIFRNTGARQEHRALFAYRGADDVMDKRYILFDLDGTLTDPMIGITRSVQYALRAYGIKEPDLTKLCPFIGPPLKDSFMKYYGFPEAQAQEAIGKYREYFSAGGIFENQVYDGIPELLEELKACGKILLVATSKPEPFALQILEHFHLLSSFHGVYGASMDEKRVKKGEVIAYALEREGIEDTWSAVMVGDREHDITGARENHMEAIGVLFGYGSREELESAGAGFLAASVEELKHLLLR